MALSITNMYGIEITLSKLFLAGFYSILLPVIIPDIPGAEIISVSSILVSINAPLDGIGVVVALISIVDIFLTLLIVISVLASTLIVAKSENQLDIEKYKNEN